jgi:hypothetical protein
MPTQDTRSQIARKVNFAIQLLREAAELLETSSKTTSTRSPRYTRRSIERATSKRLSVPVPRTAGIRAVLLLPSSIGLIRSGYAAQTQDATYAKR